jgi:DNA-binding SARP family transcriptional activator
MEFGILGSLRVRDGLDRDADVRGTRRRAMLVRLLVDADTFVSVGRLSDDLWDGAPPPGAAQTIQSHVSNLRRALGRERIENRSRIGYRLVIGADDEIDAAVFEDEVSRGTALVGSQPETAARMLETSLTRWRGDALLDAGDADWARAPRERLERIRLGAGADLLVAWLDLGDLDRVVAEAERLIVEYPFDERLSCRLMLAQYRAGRQADALRTFGQLRERLGEELGILPGPEAVDLERAILDQRPELLAPRSERASATPLPTGVATFLLTDIVASTRIWEREPEAMGVALELHDEILERSVRDSGGVLLKSRGEGDSTFSVFTRASDAARAIAAARRALHAARWNTREPLSVRMVLHTGEALEREGDYYGRTVNRAARLRSIAEGDQPLVSAATAQLIADALPTGQHLVELGLRELRDLDRPELVYLLVDDEVPVLASTGPADAAEPAFALALPPRLREAPMFVGREDALVRLRDAAWRAEAGDRQLALVGGEPGIGKTALSSRVALALHDQGWLVLYGRCDAGLNVPYQPFVEALDFLAREAPAELSGLAGTAELALVEPLLPSIRGRVPGLPTRGATDVETERFYVLSAAMRLLARLGDTRPVALVLDDLHWADASTLALLEELASTTSMRVLTIATYRDSELAPDAPLTAALAALHRHPDVHRFTLGGLGLDELSDLVAALAGHDLTSDATTRRLVAGLRDETNGNPFFALEILRYLASTGDILQNASGRWEPRDGLDLTELPDSVREVVTARVTDVGPEVGPTLTTAALIGIEFGLALLALVLERDEDGLLDVLEQAERAGLVTFVDHDRFAFSHALIANSLAQALSDLRRATLHRRIAEAIECLDPAERDAGELAGHWLAARGADAEERALAYAQLAGDRALAGLAPGDAIPWYRTALGLVAGDAARRVTLMVSLGDALRQAGNASHRDVLLEAGGAASALGLDGEVVRAALANFRGWASRAGALDGERVALLEAALLAVGEHPTATRARLLSVLAAELAFTDDLERRRALSDDAVAIARTLDDPRTLAQVLSCRFDAVRVPDTAAQRDRSTTESLALTEGFDDPIAHWFAVTDRLTVAAELGYRDEVDRRLAEEVELADELQGYQRWIALVHQAWRALVAGRFDDCESYADRGLEIGLDTGQPDAFVLYAAGLFLLRDAQGRWDELVPAMEQSIDENPDIAGFRACLAQSYAEMGRHDDARRMLAAEAGTGFASIPRDVVWATALCLFGNVAATIGAVDEAAALADVLAPHVHLIATDGAHVYQPVALAAGRLATVAGRAEAESWLTRAEDLARRFDAPVWLAEALLAQSELTGERALAEQALATVEPLGATAVGCRARRHLDGG